jgi:glycosyltransferase involved in cell wall biosynthesis
MKVAYLIDSLAAGGAERSLAEMLPHLTTAGVELRIFVLSEPELGFHCLVEQHGTEVEPLPAASWLRRRSYLRSRLVEWRPQLLHTTLFDSDVLGRMAARGTGVPVMGSLVGASYSPERYADPRIRWWRLRVAQSLDGWTARHYCTHFHAVSEAAKTSAVENLRVAPESVTVVHRGREAARFEAAAAGRASARQRWRVGDDEVLVVNVGRQVYQKAQIVLLQAVARLVRKERPVRLVVAGKEGPCSSELRSFVADHALEQSVTLAGHVDDVPELLAAADVFALPSRCEGLPGAVLEAMAAGLPVVASDIPPLHEIYPANGDVLLVPADSPESLTAALDRLVFDPELRRSLGARGRELFAQRFDVRSTAERMAHLYREVGGRA